MGIQESDYESAGKEMNIAYQEMIEYLHNDFNDYRESY